MGTNRRSFGRFIVIPSASEGSHTRLRTFELTRVISSEWVRSFVVFAAQDDRKEAACSPSDCLVL
jgi:hypothetical protein